MFRPTVASHRQGARTLTRREYTDAGLFRQERTGIFGRLWNCVGREEALEGGAPVLADVAGEPIVVVKDDAGKVNAFFNVCRHRGAQVCAPGDAVVRGRLRCPYHGWTYGTDGRLVAAPHMEQVEGFRLEGHGLARARVARWEGFLFVNVADAAPSFQEEWRDVLPRFERFGLARARTHRKVVYDIAGNWKLVFQNYNECLHCPLVHPELSRILPYDSGANDLADGPFLGGFMQIRPPHESGTTSGRRCARPLSEGLLPQDHERAYFYSLMPNLCLSIHPDYAVYFLVEPVAVDRTRLTAGWLFHPEADAMRPYRPEEAVEFWDRTNRQDWAMVERTQMGVASSRFTPGLYSARESVPAAWDEAYRRLMAAEGGTASTRE